MMYDLFDITSMNAIDWYDSLEEALASIRETIQACGPEAVSSWVLVPQDESEEPMRGQALVDRALRGVSV